MRLDRVELDRPSAPVRIVHLGLGAFFRAHQAWYTTVADSKNEWGIAAFTGRTSTAADLLNTQDCLYTLIKREASGDTSTIISSISSAYDGNDFARFSATVADENVAIVTITITEAGYTANQASAISKLTTALEIRRIKNGAPIAIVPCDNIAGNGALLRSLFDQTTSTFSAESKEWFKKSVSIVSTSVDRITPATTQADIDLVEAKFGYADASPVVTEPFSSWVLQGEFPLGRPDWELAGALFVDDISAYESRKLWFLNGAHSLITYAGLSAGYATVAEAITDPQIRALVDAFWNEASEVSARDKAELDGYKAALIERFANPRIAHKLEQIAIDGAVKLSQRVAPIVTARSNAAKESPASATLVAYWIRFITNNSDFKDSRSKELAIALQSTHVVRELIAVIDPKLSTDDHFASLVEEVLSSLSTTVKG
jgi:fructuronate reductase